MIEVRRSDERGHAEHGWLDSYHTFSFSSYYDPKFMGFRDLRVINEDYVEGGEGFPTHPHKDMEIITYVIKGALAHKDSMGNSTQILPGEVQRMSAGTGIQHSEFNPNKDQQVHLLQIWIQPEKRGIQPSYAQKSFARELETEALKLVVSKEGREGSITMNQNVDLYAAKWTKAQKVQFPLKTSRYAWVQIVDGNLTLNGERLSKGDGAAVGGESLLELISEGPAEFLLFDLP